MGTEGNPLYLKKIANRVKQLREKAGLTQEAAYFDTGVHFGRIETGKRDFSISTLKKVCDYFEVTEIEFFRGIKD